MATLALLMIFGIVSTRNQFIAHADDASSTASSTDPNASSTDIVIPTSTPTSTPSSTDDSLVLPDASTSTDASDPPAISTGDAASVANVVTVVNANITDSTGLITFLNLLQPFIGNIDLSGLTLASGTCDTCVGGTLDVSNANDANVVNNVTVTAVTGGNTVTGDGGISTGDAAAAANVVNVVNTNITGSQYLLLVLNDFSQLIGDLVLPGKSFFESFLGSGSGTGGGDLSVSNTNNASIGNNVDTSASTGGNTTDGSSTVTTGNSESVSNVVNVANQNLTGGNQVFLLINVPGSWEGNVFSAPPGLSWEQTPQGLLLTGSSAGNLLCDCNGATNVSNTNNATVENNVQVYALTGNNEVTGAGDVSTGNAAAASNVVNLVNTNIVGHNILFAIINILGDWQGNVAFGQPDLWTGIQATVDQSPLTMNSLITYHVTVINRGSADATDVQVQTSDSDPSIATIVDAGGGMVDGNSVIWNIPTIAAGDTETFTYTEKVNPSLPFGGMGSLTESASATEHEDDANPSDNTDSVDLGILGSTGTLRLSHVFVAETTNTTSTLAPGSTVGYKVVVGDKMWAGPANQVFAHETLYDPEGTPISTSTWALGSLNPGRKLQISYNMNFASDTPSGWYTSTVSLDGTDAAGNLENTPDLFATTSIQIVNPNDYKPAPTPLTFYYWFSTATTTTTGNGKSDLLITPLQSSAKKAGSTLAAAAGPSCPAKSQKPSSPYTLDLTASMNGPFADFFTSTALVFGGPFAKLW